VKHFTQQRRSDHQVMNLKSKPLFIMGGSNHHTLNSAQPYFPKTAFTGSNSTEKLQEHANSEKEIAFAL